MTDIPPRWYCVDRHGMTTLCADEDNARAEAAENDILWPRNAPHTAVQLDPAPAQPAEAECVEALAIDVGAVVGMEYKGGPLAEAAFSRAQLHEFARRLRNSPQPVSNGPFGAFYVCPTCSGTAVVTQSVHDAARSAGGTA